MEGILLVNIFIKTLILRVTSWIIVCFQSLIMIHFRSFEENLCLDRNSLRKLLKFSIHLKPLLMPVGSTDPYLGNLELFSASLC